MLFPEVFQSFDTPAPADFLSLRLVTALFYLWKCGITKI